MVSTRTRTALLRYVGLRVLGGAAFALAAVSSVAVVTAFRSPTESPAGTTFTSNDAPMLTKAPGQPYDRATMSLEAVSEKLAALETTLNAVESTVASSGGGAIAAKRVFITSTTYDGNLGGLTGADAKCQTRADAASLGGTWKASLSTTTVAASDRMTYNYERLVDIHGGVLAAQPIVQSGVTYLAPWNFNLVRKILFDEFGALLPTDPAEGHWKSSGTTHSGPQFCCSSWTSNSAAMNGYVQSMASTLFAFANTSSYASCDVAQRLVCIEQ